MHLCSLFRIFSGHLAKNAMFFHGFSEDSDQSVQISRMICLLWAHMSEGTVSHVAANMMFVS